MLNTKSFLAVDFGAGSLKVAEFEINEAGGRPLVKVYSRKEAKALFGEFREVAVEVEQLTREELRFFAPLISDKSFRKLSTKVGWNVIVTAKK